MTQPHHTPRSGLTIRRPQAALVPLSALEQIVASASLGFAKVAVVNGTFLYANAQFCSMVGVPIDKLVRDRVTVRDLAHPDDFKRCVIAMQSLLAGDIDSYTMEKRCTVQGAWVPFRVTITVLERSAEGNVLTIGLIAVPVEAPQREVQAPGVLHGASLWTHNFVTRTGDCSDGFKILLGRPVDSPPPSFSEAIAQVHPEDRLRVMQDVLRAKKGLSHTSEFRIHRQNGELRWVGQTVSPIIDANGEVVGAVGGCLDITDAKRLAKQTPAANTARMVQQYVDVNWSRPLTIDDLAEAAGVNARTLFKHFKQARGFTPQEYIKRVRLNHARAMLQAGDRTTTVLGTALKCCFQNQGHFARDYRLAFGERPSETLERARRIERPVPGETFE